MMLRLLLISSCAVLNANGSNSSSSSSLPSSSSVSPVIIDPSHYGWIEVLDSATAGSTSSSSAESSVIATSSGNMQSPLLSAVDGAAAAPDGTGGMYAFGGFSYGIGNVYSRNDLHHFFVATTTTTTTMTTTTTSTASQSQQQQQQSQKHTTYAWQHLHDLLYPSSSTASSSPSETIFNNNNNNYNPAPGPRTRACLVQFNQTLWLFGGRYRGLGRDMNEQLDYEDMWMCNLRQPPSSSNTNNPPNGSSTPPLSTPATSASHRWVPITTKALRAGRFPGGRSAPVCTLRKDTIIMYGGVTKWGDVFNDLWAFHIPTRTWGEVDVYTPKKSSSSSIPPTMTSFSAAFASASASNSSIDPFTSLFTTSASTVSLTPIKTSRYFKSSLSSMLASPVTPMSFSPPTYTFGAGMLYAGAVENAKGGASSLSSNIVGIYSMDDDDPSSDTSNTPSEVPTSSVSSPSSTTTSTLLPPPPLYDAIIMHGGRIPGANALSPNAVVSSALYVLLFTDMHPVNRSASSTMSRVPSFSSAYYNKTSQSFPASSSNNWWTGLSAVWVRPPITGYNLPRAFPTPVWWRGRYCALAGTDLYGGSGERFTNTVECIDLATLFDAWKIGGDSTNSSTPPPPSPVQSMNSTHQRLRELGGAAAKDDRDHKKPRNSDRVLTAYNDGAGAASTTMTTTTTTQYSSHQPLSTPVWKELTKTFSGSVRPSQRQRAIGLMIDDDTAVFAAGITYDQVLGDTWILRFPPWNTPGAWGATVSPDSDTDLLLVSYLAYASAVLLATLVILVVLVRRAREKRRLAEEEEFQAEEAAAAAAMEASDPNNEPRGLNEAAVAALPTIRFRASSTAQNQGQPQQPSKGSGTKNDIENINESTGYQGRYNQQQRGNNKNNNMPHQQNRFLETKTEERNDGETRQQQHVDARSENESASPSSSVLPFEGRPVKSDTFAYIYDGSIDTSVSLSDAPDNSTTTVPRYSHVESINFSSTANIASLQNPIPQLPKRRSTDSVIYRKNSRKLHLHETEEDIDYETDALDQRSVVASDGGSACTSQKESSSSVFLDGASDTGVTSFSGSNSSAFNQRNTILAFSAEQSLHNNTHHHHQPRSTSGSGCTPNSSVIVSASSHGARKGGGRWFRLESDEGTGVPQPATLEHLQDVYPDGGGPHSHNNEYNNNNEEYTQKDNYHHHNQLSTTSNKKSSHGYSHEHEEIRAQNGRSERKRHTEMLADDDKERNATETPAERSTRSGAPSNHHSRPDPEQQKGDMFVTTRTAHHPVSSPMTMTTTTTTRNIHRNQPFQRQRNLIDVVSSGSNVFMSEQQHHGGHQGEEEQEQQSPYQVDEHHHHHHHNTTADSMRLPQQPPATTSSSSTSTGLWKYIGRRLPHTLPPLLTFSGSLTVPSDGMNNSHQDVDPPHTTTSSSLPAHSHHHQHKFDPNIQNSCPICLCEYEDGTEVTVLPCQHGYHTECVRRWLSNHRVCPMCKDDVAIACGM